MASTSTPSIGAHVPFPSKSRGATACEKCRLRKTKCDNRRPSCGYCLKRNIHCVYPDDNDPGGSVTGADILQAINKLTQLVEGQQREQHVQDAAQVASPSLSWPRPVSQSQEARHQHESDLPPYSVMRPQGVESILEWHVFASDRPTSCLFAQRHAPDDGNHPLPDTSYSQLARLESKYIDHLHSKNPILDLTELHQMILHVAENGLDWSTRTCLVTLVCAIAAIAEAYPTGTEMYSTSPSQKNPESSAEAKLAMQFWSLAVKRLGFAASQNSVQAVQCLCLAGIWHMHRMQPLEAWKHFNLAGAAWHSLSLIEFPFGELVYGTGGPSNQLTVMQALYFTIWKSECELRLELPLPSPPVLDNTYFPLEFPQPPSLGSQPSSPDVADRERSWYYYLSEIAARHLTNRLLQMSSDIPDAPTERQVGCMIKQAEMMEAQVFDWYSSLPNMFSFDIPDGDDADFQPDAMIFVLRHRYFTLRELVSRPFVRLCVDHLVDEMHHSVQARVGAFAAQCLRFCMLKLCQNVAHRHQGTWYMLRTTACSSLILAAVCRAQRRAREGRGGGTPVQSLVLPEGWRWRIRRAVESAQPYFDEPNGGASRLKKTIQVVLGTTLDEETFDGSEAFS